MPGRRPAAALLEALREPLGDPLGAGWKDNPLTWLVEEARLGGRKARDVVGGPARAKVIALLAAVLALDSADKGATGALAVQLEAAFHIGNVELGLMVAVSSLVGAFAAIPMGVLADRTRRVRMLAVAVVIWAVAEAASGFAVSYLMLLLIRVGLGVVTAAAGPMVTSLIGDLFPPGERARIYGYVITGELVGAGAGLVVSGDLASVLTWRGGYMVLALPSLALGWYLWRSLPEPARGGQSFLQEGATEVVSIEEVEAHPEEHPPPLGDSTDEQVADRDEVLAAVREQDIEPEPENVLEGNPQKVGIIEAVRWVLRVRTNVALIVASALGYFFLGGVRSFSVIFVRGWYGVGQASASSLVVVIGVGAVVGALVVARLTDGWIRRGRFDARMITGAAGYVLAAVVFVPALFSTELAVALPLIVVASFFLGGANPPVDAARMDVIPSRMWGRAEAIRTLLRQVLEACAPLVFGIVASALGATGVSGFGAGVKGKHIHVSHSEALGLDHTFMIMLVPLALSGVLLLIARHRYAVDVASAGASEENTAAAVDAGR